MKKTTIAIIALATIALVAKANEKVLECHWSPEGVFTSTKKRKYF